MSQGNTVTPVTAMEIGSALWLKVDGALEQRQRLLHYVSPLTSSRLARGPGLLFNKPVPTHPPSPRTLRRSPPLAQEIQYRPYFSKCPAQAIKRAPAEPSA